MCRPTLWMNFVSSGGIISWTVFQLVSPIDLMVSWRHFTAFCRKLGSFSRTIKLGFFAQAMANSGHPFVPFEDWLGVMSNKAKIATRKRFRYRKNKSAISILNDVLYKVILVWITCTGGKDFKTAAKSRQKSKAEIGSSSVVAGCNTTTTAVP